jgi:hypothetical protein
MDKNQSLKILCKRVMDFILSKARVKEVPEAYANSIVTFTISLLAKVRTKCKPSRLIGENLK